MIDVFNIQQALEGIVYTMNQSTIEIAPYYYYRLELAKAILEDLLKEKI